MFRIKIKWQQKPLDNECLAKCKPDARTKWKHLLTEIKINITRKKL